jgi:hypothetical protein
LSLTASGVAGQGCQRRRELHDDVLGRTFVITDRDGNLIRVCAVDK